MAGETYYDWSLQSEYVNCRNLNCRSCPHGPYWYGYRRRGTKTQKKYMGKHRQETPERFDADYLTAAVLGVAIAMWTDRRETLAPILADALEDAGYHDTDTLSFLRRPIHNPFRLHSLIERIVGKPYASKWR